MSGNLDKQATQAVAPMGIPAQAQPFVVLVADDSPSSTGGLIDGLAAHGYQTLLATNGDQALALAQSAKPDIILLDIVMPGIDGFETCHRLKTCTATEAIPVIFMSALIRSEDKIKGFRLGAVDYIVKPVLIEEALARIRIHLHLSSLSRELQEKNRQLESQRLTLEQQVTVRTTELSVKNLQLRAEVAERKRMERSLRRREREFRTLAENSPDLIVRFDRQCRRIYLNPACEKKNGIAATDLLGKSPTEYSVTIRPIAAEYQNKIQRVLDTGIPCECDMEWKALDESTVSYSVHIVPEYDEHGEIASALAISRDISERKRSESMLRASREQLQMLMKQNETAREEERKSLARELHDELGQLLTALRMRAGLLHMDFIEGDPQWLKECSNDILVIVDRAVSIVRDVITALRPGVMDMGLASALRWLGDEFSKSSQVDCKVSIPRKKLELNDKTAMSLFRIAQESLTNVFKHAHATEASITLRQHGQRLTLSIRDNGKGFDTMRNRPPGSFGLIGMEERVRMLGGTQQIVSGPGQGTMITVSIPWTP